MWATIHFQNLSWWWLSLGLAAAGLSAVLWNYWRSPLPGSARLGCTALKLIGLLALILCLLEPLWTSQRAKPGANHLLLLADNSQSLTLRETPGGPSRAEILQSWLSGDQAGWQAAAEETFQVRRYWFDTRLQPARHFSDMDCSGPATALRSALQSLLERYRNRPVAGIVLFTDGNATDLPEAGALAGAPPIYPVLVGQQAPARDVVLRKITASQTAFEDAPVTIQAEVTTHGYRGQSIQVQVWGLTPSPSGMPDSVTNPPPGADSWTLDAEQQQRVLAAQEDLSFRFQFRPRQSGLRFYRVHATPFRPAADLANPEPTEEATLVNNDRFVVVHRGQGPYRILYVSGRPSWEFKFLNRALSADDQILMAALIRIARREPKFEFRGRPGEASNPLYRGFDRTTEETERYDQPVLVRFNTRDDQELRGGFPQTPEELFDYHALVLDDLEASFFSHDQLTLINRFVAERGGALLMLGGKDSLADGQYRDTPLGPLLPVYLDSTPPAIPSLPLQWQLTREGWLEPWTRLRSTEEDERRRVDTMPPFQVLNPARTIKPGATVLATVTDGRGQLYPALACQRFGRGRVAALLVGDYWRWGLREASLQADLAKAWRQLTRWLVTDVPPFVELEALPTQSPFLQAAEFLVRVRDKNFQPVDNASVSLQVQPLPDLATVSTNRPARHQTDPGSSASPTALTLNPEPSLTEAGRYNALYVPRQRGVFLAHTKVNLPTGESAGTAQAGWAANPGADEFARLAPHRALLEDLARLTGGEMVTLSDLPKLIESLPLRDSPVTETWTRPLWHRALVFLLALACFIAEWGLRRWHGLA